MKKTLISFVILAFICLSAGAQRKIGIKEVYKDSNVMFNQIDDHTWVGTGNLCYNESLYLVEGNDKAILIDAGTKIPGLKKIVESITSKPVTLLATHVHGDHTGEAINEFDKIYISPGDTVMIPANVKDFFKGEILYLKDGEKIDLGGRVIDVIFTPGHTYGSVSFFDKDKGYGFSGDAFGSGNLLVFTDFTTLKNTCDKVIPYLEKNKIKVMYPGHYWGDNLETIETVKGLKSISEDVLAGKLEGKENTGDNYGLDRIIEKYGLKVNYNSKAIK
ncbi:MBL fold metallo-hydrolase [Phocaeicola paurosaccharolyticus]|jgi:hydroxyacylglutathione hydrolase|uniref:MBL fold metallo-hydrolase n=1 Tax=Phocaeicola paurosaccharolyticus TaxID=732242 RepID=UPI000468BD0D|nr:MBL fold metallo-hydrolase [Phocaeicola paurosaccharolyticus]